MTFIERRVLRDRLRELATSGEQMQDREYEDAEDAADAALELMSDMIPAMREAAAELGT